MAQFLIKKSISGFDESIPVYVWCPKTLW